MAGNRANPITVVALGSREREDPRIVRLKHG
jgi:hypothetical protein